MRKVYTVVEFRTREDGQDVGIRPVMAFETAPDAIAYVEGELGARREGDYHWLLGARTLVILEAEVRRG